VTGLARARNFGIEIGDWMREMEGWGGGCCGTYVTVWLCGGRCVFADIDSRR
jgi:hypothetical protein